MYLILSKGKVNNLTISVLLYVQKVYAPHSNSKWHLIFPVFLFQEKQERAIGLLVSLGPQPGTEVTPWYMKTGKEKEELKEKEERKDKDKRKGISEEEREKKDRRLKDSLDPLKDMKKALNIKEKKHHKSKKHEKKDKGERRSSGERYENLLLLVIFE